MRIGLTISFFTILALAPGDTETPPYPPAETDSTRLSSLRSFRSDRVVSQTFNECSSWMFRRWAAGDHTKSCVRRYDADVPQLVCANDNSDPPLRNEDKGPVRPPRRGIRVPPPEPRPGVTERYRDRGESTNHKVT